MTMTRQNYTDWRKNYHHMAINTDTEGSNVKNNAATSINVDALKAMEDALEAGAVDFITDEEDIFVIRTEPNDLGGVRDDLEAKGYTFVSAEVEYIPNTETALTDADDLKMMGRLLEMLEDNDDVQNVWHNLENEDDLP